MWAMFSYNIFFLSFLLLHIHAHTRKKTINRHMIYWTFHPNQFYFRSQINYVNSDIRSTPNQSKSFRVLQQITDTMKSDPTESVALNKPAELHQPHYSRPLGPNDMNEHQLRKMKLNDGNYTAFFLFIFYFDPNGIVIQSSSVRRWHLCDSQCLSLISTKIMRFF